MMTLRHVFRSFLRALASGLGLAAFLLLGFALAETSYTIPAQFPPDQFSQILVESPPGIVTAVDHHLERNGLPFEVRGMNYYPKDFAWDQFWVNYTTAVTQIDRELDLAKALGINTVRIFLPYDHFNGSNQTYLNYLEDFVDRLQARDMVAIVTLFDLYSSPPYLDYPGSKDHINAVVSTLGSTNPAVLAWDIKNELDRDYNRDDLPVDEKEVKDWAKAMINYVRKLDPNHMITIGFYGVVNGTPCYDPTNGDEKVYSPAIAAEFAGYVDFVSMHYFLSERCFESDLKALQALIGDKPLVLEEFALHTLAAPSIPCATNPDDPRCDVPHTEAEQAAYYNALLSVSEANDVAGYLFWPLTDFSYILPGSQESHHCQGILRNSLVDVCQVTSALDYSEKPAADTVRRHYDVDVAYLDLFDSWVVSDTDKPPPGWSDNWSEGGALLRGFNPSVAPEHLLWSRDPGKIAIAKFVTNTTSIAGVAVSPALTNLDVEQYPFLVGQVYNYSIRDRTNGSHSTLHIGVRHKGKIIRLLTITPGTSLPYPFILDLRQPPLNWSGTRDFQIVFELIPDGASDGYSATYELDWIGLVQAGLNVTKQASSRLVQDGAQLRYTIRVTNTNDVPLRPTITDTLPDHVAPTGVLTWTPSAIAPGDVWMRTVVVTVEEGYSGSLINRVQVTSDEGVEGNARVTVCANHCIDRLPIVLK